MVWIWRLVMAVLGTAIYYMVNAPDWRNRFLLLYDIPTLPVAFACAGELLFRLASGERAAAWIRLIGLLVAVGCGAGAQYKAWPLSGHLTVATTVALLQLSSVRDPLAWRLLSLLPILLLIGIRTFRPQTALMGNTFNTCSGLILGALIGSAVLLLLPRP
ncbi:MAG TPA: hypothetical protein VKU00_13615 [Chthonomonadaceae bacterium]|nr:hypothetical protein [Chthonomonadaceae bacterium]